MSDSDADWRKWGERDAYFGVLTDKRFRRASLDEHRAAFFQTGEIYVTDRLNRIERALGPIARGRALDFGAGVGRIAIPLAAVFDEVVGLDIAPAMLAEATANSEAAHLTNTRFLLSDDELSRATGRFDLVHTYIVLQHIPVGRGMAIIGRLLDRVAPDGVVSLHVSVRRDEHRLAGLLYKARQTVPGLNGLVNLLRKLPWDAPMMQMNEYPLDRIEALLEERGFGTPLIEAEQHGKFGTASLAARRL